MARLEGRDVNVGPRWFSLTPVRAAEPGQDATEYLFETWPGPDGGVWARTFSLAEWFPDQDDVWVLARAFAETPTLLETRIPINLFRTGRGRRADLFESARWLQVRLVGNQIRRWIMMALFVQEGVAPDVFRSFVMRTDVDQAERFGHELEQEMIAACPNWAAKRKLATRAVLGDAGG